MKKLFITLQLALTLTCAHAQKAYTLQDWNIKDYELMDELKRTLETMEIDYYKPAVKCARSRILSGKLK